MEQNTIIEPTNKSHRIMFMVGTILLTAGIVGGSVWYVMDKQAKEQQKQIEELNKKAETKVDTKKEKVKKTETDETADWKSYSSKELGLGFKYPSNYYQDVENDSVLLSNREIKKVTVEGTTAKVAPINMRIQDRASVDQIIEQEKETITKTTIKVNGLDAEVYQYKYGPLNQNTTVKNTMKIVYVPSKNIMFSVQDQDILNSYDWSEISSNFDKIIQTVKFN